MNDRDPKLLIKYLKCCRVFGVTSNLGQTENIFG
jgi:hypothetical protein